MASQIFVLVILIALNAFFAATEIAFISLNDVKIELRDFYQVPLHQIHLQTY